MPKKRIDAAVVKVAAQGRCLEILRSLGGLSDERLNGRNQPCPRCGGTDRFRLLDADTGALFCNRCFNSRNGDVIAALQWLHGWTFPETLDRLAEFLGLTDGTVTPRDVPRFDEQADLKPMRDWEPARHISLLKWSKSKPPIAVDACLTADPHNAAWPAKANHPQSCIAFPAYRNGAEPSGWILYRTDGKNFEAVPQYNLSERKSHNLCGSKDGWVFLGGRKYFDECHTVLKTEGLPDALSVYPLLPDGWCVITNICGCGNDGYWCGKSCPPMSVFKGKTVIGIGDADQPGMAGVTAFAESAARYAVSSRVADLPYDVVDTHGRDLRDWVAEGNGRTELQQLLDAATSVAAKKNQTPKSGRSASPCAAGHSGSEGEGKKSQATELVELALSAGVVLFHYGTEAFARIPVNSHHETWRIGSKGFREWLRRAFWLANEAAPGSQAMQDAIGVLTGKALFDGDSQTVAVRIAEHQGRIYIDLADAEWRTIEVTAEGWQVITEPPVRFVRPNGVKELPAPVAGGRIDELRELVNVPDDDDWLLLLSWLVAAFRPRGPYPVLGVHGEQGSAKSTLCRTVRSLIDPNGAALRSSPKEPRDLMIAATNAWCIGFDNLSKVPEWLSDALCRLSTGGGFSTRALYSDAEEKLFDAMRPILLNGIPELASRPDLLDRTLVLSLPPVPESKRKPEAELQRQFEAARPRILGALLDAVSTALRNESTVKLAGLPRMADFAVWATAAEPAFGVASGSFIAAYTANRAVANESAIESSIVAEPLLRLAAGDYSWPDPEYALPPSDQWEGSATELLEILSRVVGEKGANGKEWPKKPHILSSELRRISPNLRRIGVNVAFDRTRSKRTIRVSGKPPVSPKGPDSS